MSIKLKPTLVTLLATSMYSVSTYAVDTDFYALDRNSDNARSLTNPIIPIGVYIDENTDKVNVKFEFDKSNSITDEEACVTVNFVQILTNRDIPINYGVNGDPIVSQWETVWEREDIRASTGGDNVEPLDIDLLRDYCLAQNEVTDFTNWHKTRGDSDEWSFVLGQGWDILGGRYFNSSTDYQDAELRVGIVYFPKRYPYEASVYTSTHVGTLEERFDRDDEWQVAFKAEMTLSLHDTISVVEEVYDHKLKELSAISGYDLPVAYVKQANGNSGCYATTIPGEEIWSGGILMLKYPDTIDCLFASANTSINDVKLTGRSDADRLIMCPGSTIQPHVDLTDIISQGAEAATSTNSPYPQVMVSGNPAWCQNIEKIERSWTDLTSISEEGWMVGINQQTGNLECIAMNGVCANSLVDSIKLSDIDTPNEALALDTLVLTGSSQDCHYKDSSISACPYDLYISEPSLIDVVNAFQVSAFRDLNSLSFSQGEFLLNQGDSITTENRRLEMQYDGNLVLYRYVDGSYDGALWETGTDTTGGYKVKFSRTGNLAVRDVSNAVIWQQLVQGDSLKLQGDGDLVIYSSTGESLWSTGTAE